MKNFVNGFDSWHETHFEIVDAITHELRKDNYSGEVKDRQDNQGRGGIYELAQELTDKFEATHEGREWNGEYPDVIFDFILAELY